MILRLVAPFSQSMSSFRATATHFMPETITFQRSPTTKTHNPHLQNLNFRGHTYCKYNICVLQIQKYGIKAPIIYCKYKFLCIPNTEILYKCSDYILQIYKFFARNKHLYIVNIYIYIYILNI